MRCGTTLAVSPLIIWEQWPEKESRADEDWTENTSLPVVRVIFKESTETWRAGIVDRTSHSGEKASALHLLVPAPSIRPKRLSFDTQQLR